MKLMAARNPSIAISTDGSSVHRQAAPGPTRCQARPVDEGLVLYPWQNESIGLDVVRHCIRMLTVGAA
jgi:hypothetical protein